MFKTITRFGIKHNQTQIMIEAPFRNQFLLDAIITNLANNIILCIAIDLMCENQEIISQPILNWKKMQNLPNLYKRETIFVIGR